jgi:tetratricopeptide (TPR) repeat protein
MLANDKNEILPNPEDVIKNISDLFNEKKYDACEVECEKLLTINPHITLANLYLGEIFEQRKEYKKAIEYYSRVLEILPDLTLVYAMRGINQFEIGDYKGAKDSLVQYLTRNDHDTKVWGIVAQLEHILSGRRNAMQVLDEAEKRTTKNKDLIYRARGAILRPTDPDSALIYFLKAQTETKEEKQKEKYGEEIYRLIVKHIDPLRRSKVIPAKNQKE